MMSRGLAPQNFTIFPHEVMGFVEKCGFIDDGELAFSGN
jgi:hypothetical protein